MGRIRVLDVDPLLFLIQRLDESLPADVHVGEKEDAGATRSVTLRLDGGRSEQPWTTTSSVGINVRCATLAETMNMAREVRSWVEFATDHHLCLRSSCTMPAEVLDESRDHRAYMSAQITLSQYDPDQADPLIP